MNHAGIPENNHSHVFQEDWGGFDTQLHRKGGGMLGQGKHLMILALKTWMTGPQDSNPTLIPNQKIQQMLWKTPEEILPTDTLLGSRDTRFAHLS